MNYFYKIVYLNHVIIIFFNRFKNINWIFYQNKNINLLNYYYINKMCYYSKDKFIFKLYKKCLNYIYI